MNRERRASSGAAVDQWTAIGSDCIAKKFVDSDLSSEKDRSSGSRMISSTQQPEVVHAHWRMVFGERLEEAKQSDEGPEASHELFSWRQVFFQSHPGARPGVQIAAVGGRIGGRRRASKTIYFRSLSP